MSPTADGSAQDATERLPSAAIIIASYNQAAWLPQAIESALGQTVDDIEVLVIDNGSSDDSVEIARRYKSDPRLRVHARPTNEPIGRRLNEGVRLARAPFVSFLYSDDMLLPEKIEHQLAMFERLDPEYAVVYGPARIRNERTGVEWTASSVAASGDVLRTLLVDHRRGQVDMVSPLTRRSVLLAHPFYEDVFAEGEGIFLRIAVDHRFAYDAKPTVILRDHGGNAGKALVRNHEMTMVGVTRLLADPRLDQRARGWVRTYRHHLELDYGWQAVRLGGDRAWARRRLWAAAVARPHPKAIAGLALAILPRRVLDAVNAVVSSRRPTQGNDVIVTGYGGGDERR